MIPYNRIMLIGCPGSGKTTVARRLAAASDLPLTHLDQEYWRADWTQMPWEEFQARVAELAAGERWILDGNMGGTYELRWRRADLVIFLDTHPLVNLRRIFKRYGQERPDMPEGMAKDQIFRLHNLSLWLFVLYFRLTERPGILKLRRKYPEAAFLQLKNQKEIDKILAEWGVL